MNINNGFTKYNVCPERENNNEINLLRKIYHHFIYEIEFTFNMIIN